MKGLVGLSTRARDVDDRQALARVLADDDALRGVGEDAARQRRLWDLAVSHFLHLPLAWRLTGEAGASWSGELRLEARGLLADGAVLEELQRRELVGVMAALSDAGVRALLLKGAAWAYQVYPLPFLRSRDDTDLLMEASDRDRTAAALVGFGYEPAHENTAELATAQRHFSRLDGQHFEHSIDVHWRVTNPLLFAGALPFARAWARSVPIDALGGARALGPVDALLLACLHRLAHHGDDSSLLWVYDIHWLASRLTTTEWDEVVDEAAVNHLCGACLQGLTRSTETFGTSVPLPVLASLAKLADPAHEAFFKPRIGPLDLLVSDWRALSSWRGRMRLLRAHVFPERAYMVSKYGTANPALLPFLYAHRALAGLPRWLSGPR